jgi:hypothetical protein
MVYETTVLWLFTLWEIGKAVWRIFFVLVIDSFAFNENYYVIYFTFYAESFVKLLNFCDISPTEKSYY